MAGAGGSRTPRGHRRVPTNGFEVLGQPYCSMLPDSMLEQPVCVANMVLYLGVSQCASGIGKFVGKMSASAGRLQGEDTGRDKPWVA